MTQPEIDKILRYAAQYRMTPEQLGRYLSEPPHNLTPPEATQLMDKFRRLHPQVSAIVGLPKANLNPKVGVLADLKIEKTPESAPRGGGIMNRSAVKKYALEVSVQRRAGKFTRVGADFFDAIEASLESAIRGLSEAADAPDTKDTFITGKAIKRAAEKLNKTAKGIIFRRVMTQPTMGCTLK
jgi:hypothetical protein